ncbi:MULTISPECIES: ABC transporter substrate-binding protein [unclassified Pseudactinotalea]|uniref:ABC transporter substrate-binding protein n=1 Tax=unclassified Pseudactinotalea TaxID=2649176 RepID=UPI001883DC64|nr:MULTISPECIES: ABC transporter substrate-binding protein [unclassified Pseudactinotalea]
MTASRRILAAVTATAAALALAACGSSAGDEPAEGSEFPAISFMYSPYADYAPFFVAFEKGYFDDAGVEVELIAKGGSSGETFQHVSTGNVTGGGASWAAGLYNATAAGASLAVVSSVSRVPESGPNPAPLMVREGSGITEGADLAGKKIGTTGESGFSYYSISLALASVGLSLEDVETVNLGAGDIIPALANGSIDASWTIEPISTAVADEGFGHELLDIDYHAGTELGAIIFNAEFTDEHPDAVVAFLTAYLRATQELAGGGWEDPATQEIIAEYTNLPVETLTSLALSDVDPEGKVNWESVRAQEEFFREQDSLEFEGDSGIEDVYRDDLRQQAVDALEALQES